MDGGHELPLSPCRIPWSFLSPRARKSSPHELPGRLAVGFQEHKASTCSPSQQGLIFWMLQEAVRFKVPLKMCSANSMCRWFLGGDAGMFPSADQTSDIQGCPPEAIPKSTGMLELA
ncbi:Hypothetical predicted protein [Marmota monax]|uniref:Uncharacterized protein n=1 Tax=Marmota monax TaxID=9995 RepID=A0A5E4AJ35_MARMO|nr:hypothetical protein GHT09_004369 [Marmota monax]VTJ57215.1 Hypothetical predicted protein [Marmota monax]